MTELNPEVWHSPRSIAEAERQTRYALFNQLADLALDQVITLAEAMDEYQAPKVA